MTRATKDTVAGQRYLALQREAKRTGRPTDELIQLYGLECFLERLTRSRFADHFVLKGGVLLAALGARRPTRDIDFSARSVSNDAQRLDPFIPKNFSTVVNTAILFADPVISGRVIQGVWNPVEQRWT